MTGSPRGERLRFGLFEVYAQSGDLRNRGTTVKLADKPRQALLLLLERAGEIVTREELRKRLWPAGTFVEFDDNLNATIKRLREALDDSSVQPKFIETIPRRGYKFIAPVERASEHALLPTSAAPAADAGATFSRFRPLSILKPTLAVAFVLSALLTSGVIVWRSLRHSEASAGEKQAPQVMLVVMPMANLTGSSDEQFLADGLTEDLIDELARVSPSELAVFDRTSVLRLPTAAEGAGEAAGQLGANYVLTSELRRSQTQTSVATHLRRTRDQRELWTGTFQLPLQETFLGVLVTRNVAEVLGVHRQIRNRTDLSHRRTSDLVAHQAYFHGLYHLHHNNKVELLTALDSFDEALRHDPQFAMPLAGKARAYLLLSFLGAVQKTEGEAKAEAAMLAGTDLDSGIADFFVLRGELLVSRGAAHGDIEKEYQQALEIDPNNGEALDQYALYLRERRPMEALQYIERARHLDPLSPRINADFGWVLMSAGKLDDAYSRLQATLRLDPEFPPSLSLLGNVEKRRGHPDLAISWYEKAANSSGREPQYLYRLARAYAEAGRREDVRRILTELQAESRTRSVEPEYIRSLQAMLGG